MSNYFDYDNFKEHLYCYAPTFVYVSETIDVKHIDLTKICDTIDEYNLYNEKAFTQVMNEPSNSQCSLILSTAVFSSVQREYDYSPRSVHILENRPLYENKMGLEIA